MRDAAVERADADREDAHTVIRNALRGVECRNTHRAVTVAHEHDRRREVRTGRESLAYLDARVVRLGQMKGIDAGRRPSAAEDVVTRRHVRGRVDREQRSHQSVAQCREALQFEALQRCDHVFTARSRRLHDIGVTAERDYADAHILRLPADELQRGGARRIEPARRNVGRRHAERDIDEEDNGSLFSGLRSDEHRARKREEQSAHAGEEQQGRRMPFESVSPGTCLPCQAEADVSQQLRALPAREHDIRADQHGHSDQQPECVIP